MRGEIRSNSSVTSANLPLDEILECGEHGNKHDQQGANKTGLMSNLFSLQVSSVCIRTAVNT